MVDEAEHLRYRSDRQALLNSSCGAGRVRQRPTHTGLVFGLQVDRVVMVVVVCDAGMMCGWRSVLLREQGTCCPVATSWKDLSKGPGELREDYCESAWEGCLAAWLGWLAGWPGGSKQGRRAEGGMRLSSWIIEDWGDLAGLPREVEVVRRAKMEGVH